MVYRQGHIITQYNKYKFTERVGNSDFRCAWCRSSMQPANAPHSTHAGATLILAGCRANSFVRMLFEFRLTHSRPQLCWDMEEPLLHIYYSVAYLLTHPVCVACRVHPTRRRNMKKKKRNGRSAEDNFIRNSNMYGLSRICIWFSISSCFTFSLKIASIQPVVAIGIGSKVGNDSEVSSFFYLSCNWPAIPSITNQHQLIQTLRVHSRCHKSKTKHRGKGENICRRQCVYSVRVCIGRGAVARKRAKVILDGFNFNYEYNLCHLLGSFLEPADNYTRSPCPRTPSKIQILFQQEVFIIFACLPFVCE